jgi:hypothetical protein
MAQFAIMVANTPKTDAASLVTSANANCRRGAAPREQGPHSPPRPRHRRRLPHRIEQARARQIDIGRYDATSGFG